MSFHFTSRAHGPLSRAVSHLARCTPQRSLIRFLDGPRAAFSSTARTDAPTSVYIDRVPPKTPVDVLKAALPAPFHGASVSTTDDPRSYKVVFDTPEAAEHALAAVKEQRVVVGGQSLSMWTPGTHKPAAKLFVTGFREGVTREALADALDLPRDAVVAPRLSRRGMFAFANFEDTEAAAAVLARLVAAPAVLGGQALEVSYASSEHPRPGYAMGATPSQWLNVSGFPEATSREALAEALGVPVDAVAEPTVSARGRYVFVRLPSEKAAEELLRRQTNAPVTLGDGGAPLTLASGGAGPSPPSCSLAFAGLGGNATVLRRLLEPYKDLGDPFAIRHLKRPGSPLYVKFVDIAAARKVRSEIAGTVLPGGAVVTVRYARLAPSGQPGTAKRPETLSAETEPRDAAATTST